jgi:hypothetical protein
MIVKIRLNLKNRCPFLCYQEAYRILSPDEFVETFSLAAPGKDFEVYSETHLKRVK